MDWQSFFLLLLILLPAGWYFMQWWSTPAISMEETPKQSFKLLDLNDELVVEGHLCYLEKHIYYNLPGHKMHMARASGIGHCGYVKNGDIITHRIIGVQY